MKKIFCIFFKVKDLQKKFEDKEHGKIYTYKNIREIIKNTKVANMDLGVYEKDLMKIKTAIEEA